MEEVFNAKRDQTIRQIVRDFNRQPIPSVLRAVFDPDDRDDTIPIPHGLHRHLCSTRVPQAKLLLTSFGDFHQLCLAHPLVDMRAASRRSGGVRRSRGIHYTPPSIVDYLTRRVFDQLSIPGRGNASERFQVLDPSCGCGAFLTSAARQLFRTLAERDGKDLSLQDRLDLLPCIRGIDIDSQAIVWARRVLLLSAWEDSLRTNIDMASADTIRIPDLRNTLIATDFLSMPIPPVDVVLGGPPFVRVHQLRLVDPQKLAQYRATFQTARTGQFDLYMLFLEKAINALREGGRLGWSVSNTFLRSRSGRTIRQLISNNCTVQELIEFEARKLYPDAVTQIALVLLEKAAVPVSCRHIWIRGNCALHTKLRALLKDKRTSDPSVTITDLPPTACHGIDWSLNSLEGSLALAKIKSAGTPIGMLPIQISSGVVTGADEVFLVRAIRAGDDGITPVRNREGSEHLIESALLRPIVRNRDVHAFARPLPRALCVVPYDETGKLLDEVQLRNRFPRAYRYLRFHQRQLAARQRAGSIPWFAFRSSAAFRLPAGPRILLKRISSRPDYAIDLDGSQLCHSSVLLLAPTSSSIDPLMLLGIFNSSIFWTFVQSIMPTMADGHAIRVTRLRSFPLPFPLQQRLKSDAKEIADVVSELLVPRLASSRQAYLAAKLNSAIAQLYG
jgi:hypothetical protein